MRLSTWIAAAAKATAWVGFYFLSQVAFATAPSSGAGTPINWAAVTQGGFASASSGAGAGFSPQSLNDGDHTGKTWAAGGGWKPYAKSKTPEWAQVMFDAAQTINTVTVYSLPDNYTSGTEPTDTQTFTKIGLTAFDVQVVKNGKWTTVASVTNNQLVKRVVTFKDATTIGVRIVCNSGPAGGIGIVEIEASGTATTSTMMTAATAAPSISSFSPTYGPVGQAVQINGSNFGSTAAANTVSFNGTVSTGVCCVAPAHITATVPSGATSGTITVTVAGQTGRSAMSFRVTGPPPTITGFTPGLGPPGTVLTVTGTNFSTYATVVYFPDSSNSTVLDIGATPTSVTSTSLTVVVPSGIQSGAIRVMTYDANGLIGSVDSTTNFIVTVPTPTITSFTPTVGPVGTTVTINGSNYDAGTPTNNAVFFNGTAVAQPDVDSTGSVLTATVPAGATTGPITVTVSSSASGIGGATGTSAANYTVGYPVPTITSFTPTHGGVSQQVNIFGTNFGVNQGSGSVQLGPYIMTPNMWTDSNIQFAIPAGAVTGLITVTNMGGQQGTSTSVFTVGPQITSFPASASVGSTITINGLNFSTAAGGNAVTFYNNVAATTVTPISSTQFSVVVPTSAVTGPITVTTNGMAVTTGTSIRLIAPQTITFPNPGTQTYAPNGTFTISPTASSGLTVTVTGLPTSVCSVSGNTVSILAAGTCTLSANQAGNATYAAAPTVTQTVTINPAPQTIQFTAVPSLVYQGTGTVAATGGGSGNAVTFSSLTTNTCTVSGTTVTGVAAGTCTLAANQTGNGNYAAAAQATTSLTVAKAPQIITFGAAPTLSVGGTATVSATGGASGNAVVFTSTTASICTVSGTTVTGVAAGNCVIAANQASSANYSAAPQVTQTIAVKQNQTITFTAPPAQTYAPNRTFSVSATATSGLAITFSATATPTVCSVSGSTVTILSAGTCTIAADQGGNGTYNPAPTATQNVTISPAAQAITFGTAPSVSVGTFGTPTLSATGGASGQPVTFSSQTTSTCSVNGSQVLGLAVGTCTVVANQAATTNYSAAPPVTQTFTVAQGTQTITWVSTPTVTVSHSATLIATGGGSGNAVVFASTTPSTCNVSGTNGSTVNGIAGGTCTIAANQAGNANYQAAPQVMQSFPILQQPTITGVNPTSGPPNTTVTITGTNFSANTAGDIVTFNGLQATVLTANPTVLTVSVPAWTSGPLVVNVGGLSVNGGTFTITPAPAVTGFAPFGGQLGDSVTIKGTNFSTTAGGNIVKFNGVAATSVTPISATQLTAIVPAGAQTGPITVTVSGQTGTSANNFFVLSSANFPSTQACAGKAPPIDPGSNPGHPGLWLNPHRAGTAWSFNFNAGGAFAATWFTYDAGGRPVWLGNQGVGLVSAQSPNEYYTPLYKVTVDPTSGAKNFTQAGQLYVAFVPGSSTNAAVRWQWNDVGAGTYDECVYDYFHSTTSTVGAAAPLDESYTGAWSPSSGNTSGWGIATTVGTCPSSGDGVFCTGLVGAGTTVEYNVPMIYDTAGNPVWLTSLFVNPTASATSTNVDYPMSTYSGGFPTSNCTNSSTCTKHYNACQTCTGNQFYNNTGVFTRSFSDNFNESVTLTVSVPGSITGAAAVSWPMGPWTATTPMGKTLTEVPLVSVNQTYCATMCTIQVSWVTSTSTAQLYKRDLTTNTLTLFQAISTGSVVDTLSSGADVQYELWNGGASGTLQYKSAEVKVGSPVQPAPTISSFTPTSGPSGKVVTISGTNFDPITLTNNVVKFNNSSPAVVQQPTTTTTLTVVVPPYATTGPISVTVGSLSGSSTTPFTVSAAVPSIGSFWPAAGPISTYVTISGQNFAPSASGNVVTFAGTSTPATIVGTPNATTIVAIVPAGAQSGAFTVSVGSITATSPQPFQIQTGTSLTVPPVPLSVASDLPTHDPKVGTMQGTASTDGGAAQYHVPIVVPPGRAGMQPNLALTYNSRSGNGPLGMGWSISGLSSIHRCPQTPEQDGQTLGVSYTNKDRLCLDGQRLVLVNGTDHAYGAKGAEYRTEIDSYARITQVDGDLSSSGASTTCFRVEQKDGRVLHYGAVTGSITNGALSTAACTISSTANSRVTPSGAPAVLSWLVEKVEDRTGNNMFYAYDASAGNGEVLLSKISYTGNGTSAGDRTVTFAYESRAIAATGAADISSSYLAGGLTMQTQALQSITTAVAGTAVRTYTPGYTVSLYSGRLLMTSLKECAGTTCHPATQFTYNDSALNFSLDSLSNLALASGLVPVSAHPIGDLDGDGAPEAVVLAQSQADHTLHAYIEQVTADGQAHSAVDLSGYLDQPYLAGKVVNPNVTEWSWVPRQSVFVDVDGDGRAKLLQAYTPGGSATVNFGVWKGGRGTLASSLVSAAGATTPAQNYAALFTTIASNIPWPTPATASTFVPQAFAADVNGDGKPDIIIVAEIDSCTSSPATSPPSYGKAVYVYLNAMTGQLTAGQTAQFTAPASPICLSFTGSAIGASVQFDHIADFSGNGMPDLFYTVTAVLNGGPSNQALTNDNYCVMPLVTTGSTVSGGSASCYFNETHTNLGTQSLVRWIDVNGDGLEDLVIATPTGAPFNGSGTWTVRLNQGGTLSSAIDTQSTAGLQTGWYNQFRYANRAPIFDVDGDGKPDLLTPSVANPFALKVCMMTQGTPLNNGQCPTVAAPQNTSTTSVSSNAICPVYACPEDPGSSQVNLPVNPNWSATVNDGAWNEYIWSDENGTQQVATGIYNAGPNSFAQAQGMLLTDGQTYLHGISTDDSVYHMDRLKFVQTGPAAFTIQVSPTPIVSRLNYAMLADDTTGLAGNGLSSPLTSIGCLNPSVLTSSGIFAPCAIVGDGIYGPANLPDSAQTPTSTFKPTPVAGSPGSFTVPVGLYDNTNHGTTSSVTSAQAVANGLLNVTAANCPAGPVLPGLLASVTNGLGDTAQWGYDSLALGRLCTRDGTPEYAVDSTYLDLRHYYFASSMPVVSAMLQSNGVDTTGTGSRSAIYTYGDAMYNHYGRGFQGFRTIATENLLSAASRRLITQTLFNQKFPLAGTIDTVTTMTTPAQNSRTIHTEHDTYVCVNADGTTATCPLGATLPAISASTVYRPVLSTQTSNEYDLGTGGAVSHTTTSNTNWDIYGNPGTQTVTRGDDAKGGVFVTSHVTTTTNTYNSPDTTNWWVNELNESTVTASIAYDPTNHPVPANTQTAGQQVDTRFTWNTDRTPATKVVQSGVTNQESTTTYTYPSSPSTSYGLPSQVTISGPSITANRTTSYTYSKDGSTAAADGYFVLTSKNALNQTTTTKMQTSDGQVISVSDPNSIVVATTYDVFGRATHITHKDPSANNIQAPIDVAYTACSPCSGVGEDSNDSAAIFRVTTVQQGAPTQVAWMDVLGRKIKQASAGFKSLSGGTLNYQFSGTLTTYDDAGTVAYQSTPYIIGSTSPFLAGYTYDALNRPTEKDTPDTCSSSDLMKTTYQYVGRKTNIQVSSTCTGGTANGSIYMSRSTNVLGQLMQTVDANGNDTTYTAGKATNYWTEPLGHVAAIKDVEGNITQATYNALGHRTQSVDPDQGTWNFTYNALGELATQTDARGVVKTITGRDALGRVTAAQQIPPSSGTNVPTEAIVDAWTWDTTADGVAQLGQLGKIVRKRGTNLATPGSNMPVWEEDYLYEAGERPVKTTTTIAENSTTATLITQQTYDTQGHLDTQTYPSGLAVKHSYTAYGQLDALYNAQTNSVYWLASTANEWGHITTEQFPGVITGTHTDYDQTGQSHTLSWSGGTVNDQLAYTYDGFGNLSQQVRSGQTGYTETYGYDVLQRLTNATRNATPVTYQYSDSGNLKLKNDYGSANYAYGSVGSTTNCGPHAVVSANGNTYSCDTNGNVVGGSTLTIAYDTENFARTASRAGQGNLTWAHGATGQLSYSQATSWGNRYYGPVGYEQLGAVGPGIKQIHELGPVIVTRTDSNASSDTVSVVLRDRLGSTINVVDNTVSTTRSYDAFGKPLEGSGVDDLTHGLGLNSTIHGFTKHEHDDDVLLINMVGRLYDYRLGRFLQVDPIIGNAANSQALNPYSYIGNNPLSGKDPTGYQWAAPDESHPKLPSDQFPCAYSNCQQFVFNAPQQNGLTGQSSNSSKTTTVANGSQGNATIDPTIRQNGNPATPGYLGQIQITGRGIAVGLFESLISVVGATPDTPRSNSTFNNMGSMLYDDPESAENFQNGHNFGYVLGLGGLLTAPKTSSVPAADVQGMRGATIEPTGSPPQLISGQAAEAGQLLTLNSSGKVPFIPTPEQANSAAFRIIVGEPQYTASGNLVGVIFDGQNSKGVVELKNGSSVLNSSYQVRLETYGALVNNTKLTIYTNRPVNSQFLDYLTRWDVSVQPLPK